MILVTALFTLTFICLINFLLLLLLLLRLIGNLTTLCLAVTASGSVGECGRSSYSPAGFWAQYNTFILNYLHMVRYKEICQ